MDGEFMDVWPASWREIWTRLADNRAAPHDFFCGLYDEAVEPFALQLDAQERADIINDPIKARASFRKMVTSGFDDERALVTFLERLYEAFNEWGGDSLANRYFGLLNGFIEKYSLRYDLRRPCRLRPTLPGAFAGLMRELHAVTRQDAHLDRLMKDFEDAIGDLGIDYSETRIKTCIQKQMNLLEGIGRACPRVSETELGGICNQVGTWPHSAIKASLKSLYGFASEYPGIRHSGNPASAIRPIEMRDMVAVSVILAGFTPYLTDELDADRAYRGG